MVERPVALTVPCIVKAVVNGHSHEKAESMGSDLAEPRGGRDGGSRDAGMPWPLRGSVTGVCLVATKQRGEITQGRTGTWTEHQAELPLPAGQGGAQEDLIANTSYPGLRKYTQMS